jgi:hypothetical protein
MIVQHPDQSVHGAAFTPYRSLTMTQHPTREIRDQIAGLSRPRLLIRAARFGLTDYRRDRDLRRLIDGKLPPEAALPRLLTVEEGLETTRLKGDASYSIARHIEVLIALMAEARLLMHRVAG